MAIKKKKSSRLPSIKKLMKLVTMDDIAPELGYRGTPADVLESNGIDPKNPETYKEYLIEVIDRRFMFAGFPGFENGVKEVGLILKEYCIKSESPAGKYILSTYIKHALSDEYYSNFEHAAYCEKCGKEFEPNYTLEYANEILKGKILCSSCKK